MPAERRRRLGATRPSRDEVAQRLGFATFTDYLLRRHRAEARSVLELCAETGLDRADVAAGIRLSLGYQPRAWPPPAPPRRERASGKPRRAVSSAALSVEVGTPSLRCSAVAKALNVSTSTVLRAVSQRDAVAYGRSLGQS